MKDYSAMSDFEINKAVANIVFSGKVPRMQEDSLEFGILNYCKNPEQAWPIIARNEISIIFNWNEYGLHAALSELPGVYLETRDNPLRAAMIVFLMMKDRGNSHA
ncbi:DUF2591 family protein [Yersinia enterocolitica]|nr:DUF2591 family protein [Yersinia enterocolitica]EKN5956374.1 DUF2591 domain-containing protein [Yersinia enterocolitica]